MGGIAQTVWSTELINETIEKLKYGAPIDMGAFYNRDPELKDGNILFQLTHKEEQEFIKCSENITYFVETYCKFMTDLGRVIVDLRDYQEDILDTLGEEIWLEDLKDFGPKVRNFILFSSRQSGKCQLFNSQIVIKNTLTNQLSKINIGELYNIIRKKQKLSFKQKIISYIKKKLYKLYKYIDK